MTNTEYLEMVDTQVREAKESMDLAEKSYREAKAKHDGLVKFKQSYEEWVASGKDGR